MFIEGSIFVDRGEDVVGAPEKTLEHRSTAQRIGEHRAEAFVWQASAVLPRKSIRAFAILARGRIVPTRR